MISFPYPYCCSQTGIWKSSQTLSAPVLTVPKKDLLLGYVVTALLITAQEPSWGHSSFSDLAEEEGVEKVEQWI